MLEEGRIYHVYNRVGGGGVPFTDDDLAGRFVQVFRRVVERDGLVVFAWALMPNHYHMVARMGAASLSRSMKSLQQLVTASRNRREGVRGPLWQGRFKAKQVEDADYLAQLIAYVHLNPVKSGVAERARQYPWSGHREILGLRRRSIVSIDDVLLVYADDRRSSLAAYRSALRSVGASEWVRHAPGKLPWWRPHQTNEDDRLDPEGLAMTDELGRTTSPLRVRLDARQWIELACNHLGVESADLGGRRRASEIVSARDVIGLIGVERYGVRVKDLAEVLGKSEDGVSLWVRRGARRRHEDPVFAATADELDRAARQGRS